MSVAPLVLLFLVAFGACNAASPLAECKEEPVYWWWKLVHGGAPLEEKLTQMFAHTNRPGVTNFVGAFLRMLHPQTFYTPQHLLAAIDLNQVFDEEDVREGRTVAATQKLRDVVDSTLKSVLVEDPCAKVTDEEVSDELQRVPRPRPSPRAQIPPKVF